MIDWVHFHLRELPARQKPSIFRRKMRTPRIRLSDAPVNSKWPNFATENQLTDGDSSQDSLGRNYGRYWQKKWTFLFAILRSVSSHKLFGCKMLRQEIDAKSENNYVTITFVQLRRRPAFKIGRDSQFAFKQGIF